MSLQPAAAPVGAQTAADCSMESEMLMLQGHKLPISPHCFHVALSARICYMCSKMEMQQMCLQLSKLLVGKCSTGVTAAPDGLTYSHK